MNEQEARQETKRVLANTFLGFGAVCMLLLLMGCGKKTTFSSTNPPVPPEADVLLEVEAQEQAAGCQNSGATINTGLDYNDNGELEMDEIVDTEVVCTKFYTVKKCKKKKDDEESSDD